MTEDDLSRGRWQGSIGTRVENLEAAASRTEERLDAVRNDTISLKTRMSIVWAVLAAVAMLMGSAVFKLWTSGALAA